MTGVDGAVTARELATILDCHVLTIYNLARADKIPHIKLGRAYRFFPEDVKARLTAPAPSWAQSAKSTGRKRAA